MLRQRFFLLFPLVAQIACTATVGGGNDPGGGGSGAGNDIGGGGEAGTGIVGTGGDSGSGGGVVNLDPTCVKPDPGPSPIRRLTRWEYDNTVRDLLGDMSGPSTVFPPDNKTGPFLNDASVQNVPSLLAESYMQASERLVSLTWTNAKVTASLGCTAAAGNQACASGFIDKWGKRAWRRPVEADEKSALLALYTALGGDASFVIAVQGVMQAMLQSPEFLYRVEMVRPVDPTTKFIKLTPWETASRLSYMIWASMPDDELFTAAEQGKLSTKEEVAAQARRMIDSPAGRTRTRQMVATFHRQWLELEKIDTLEKDPAYFPSFPTQRTMMRQETEAFADSVFWDGQGTLRELLTAPFTVVNKVLAQHYKFPTVPPGDAFVRVDLDPAKYSGFLTQGSWLASHAKMNQTYPPGRGLYVRQNLFCQTLPPPVQGVEAPVLDRNLTGRERWETHAHQACAAACHLKMDPIGLGFENFDAVGRYRDLENDKPVDASGEIIDTDVDGTFVGVTGLTKKLEASPTVSACMMTQWFQFAYGRGATERDACNVDALKKMFLDSGSSFRELLVSLTQTDAFLQRSAGGGL